MSGVSTVQCADCGAPALAGDRYCERCGAVLIEAGDGCRACGAPAAELDGDGYCTRCGVRARPAHTRREIDATVAAGVSDAGLVRAENQDALHIEVIGDAVVAIVCDGISACAEPASAARLAAASAGAVLADALRGGRQDLEAATVDAVQAAQSAVTALPHSHDSLLEPPSCTLVSAVCRDGEVVVGSVGDSRAYWLSATHPRQLTIDDAEAHAVTRWIGADAPADPPPVATLRAPAGGRLVLCSDGLWNYVPKAGDLARIAASGGTPVATARLLADHALAAGGRDNVTVAVIEMPPTGRVVP